MFIKTLNALCKCTSYIRTIKNYSSSSTAMKVTVIGAAGKVAQPLCLLLKQSPLIDELCIHDIGHTAALAAELNHVDTNCKVVAFSGTSEYGKALHSFLAIATNPINSLIPMTCEILKKRGAYNPNSVFGVTTLDTVRANTFAARVLGLEPECVMVPVIGGNTEDTMVPVLSSTKPSPEYTTEEIESITATVRKAKENMLKLKPPVNGHFVSAFACARLVISLVKAIRGHPDVIECAYVPSKAHPNVNYLSTPLLLGPSGIAKNLGIPKLSEFESCLLDNAVMYLRNDIQRGEKFVGALHTPECDPCDVMIPRCPKNWCDFQKEERNKCK
uniref:Malate dehydrogenase, mitochondrial n=1 Tax=Diabrotica virgifera virgifera TaxID=50390 RepID=A0A6P7F7D2_DIAVI